MKKKYSITLKLRNMTIICFATVGLWACSRQFRITNGPVTYQSRERYQTYSLIPGSTDSLHRASMNEMNKQLNIKLSDLGLNEDSLHPELLFITRWETHAQIVHTVKKDEAIIPTSSIKNSVYSPFVNTSDRLDRPLASMNGCEYQLESFFRFQAIDAKRQEVVWSVKIYPRKSNVNYVREAREVIQRLDYSYLNVSSAKYKNKR